MAIHWQYIKGVNCANSDSAPVYTYINFSSATNTMPSIMLAETDVGQIVTLGRDGQKFTQSVAFTGVECDTYQCTKATVTGTSITYTLSQLDSGQGVIWQGATAGIVGWINSQGVTAKNITAQQEVWGQTGKFTSSCSALYFNATSDKRAKENIIPLSEDALEWINHTTIYSFNYLNNGDPTVGVIAQDLKPIGKVDFVTKRDATGENGDYMQVNESKFVYVAMRAIQQLSVQVQDLQAQLQALKKPQA